MPVCPPGQLINSTGGCDPAYGPINPPPTSPPPVTPPTTPGVCPAGQHWNAGTQTCQPNEVGTHLPTPPVRRPDDTSGPCPDGMHWNNNAKECRPGPGPGGTNTTGAGGGGGGGGGGGTGGPGFVLDPGLEDYDTKIKGWIDALMNGEWSPYGPAQMEAKKSDLFSASQGRLRQATDEVYRDAIRRGVARGGIPAEGVAGANRTAISEYTGGVKDLLVEKANSDLQQRMAALSAAEKWLDSRRQYLLQKESNAIQREIGLANIRLGYARIASEKELLQMQLNARQIGQPGIDWSGLQNILNTITPPGAPPPHP